MSSSVGDVGDEFEKMGVGRCVGELIAGEPRAACDDSPTLRGLSEREESAGLYLLRIRFALSLTSSLFEETPAESVSANWGVESVRRSEVSSANGMYCELGVSRGCGELISGMNCAEPGTDAER